MSPVIRPRRLRFSPAIRHLVRETILQPADFIYPLFVRHGESLRIPIDSMPGQAQLTIDLLAEEAREIAPAGHPGGDLVWHPGAKRCDRQRQFP